MISYFDSIKKFEVVLASQSPRRRQLLHELGISFSVIPGAADESFPESLKREKAVIFIAEKKSEFYKNSLRNSNTMLITADTIVCLGNEMIGKPSDHKEAVMILKKLSGRMHEVFSAVCVRTLSRKETFCVRSEVYFKNISAEEINYYVEKYKPFDKAGAYGVQDWLGLTSIERINGSFHNVMGLPVKELYETMKKFF